jgi:hypothetical protein
MTCPNCTNGMILPAMPHKDFYGIKCDICNGTGVFPDNYVYIPKLGRLIRARVKESFIRNHWTTRQLAEFCGVDATELAMWKRGIFRNQFEGGE